MVNKKYLLLAGICSVLAVQPVMAQESENTTAGWSGRDMTYRGETYDVLDSNYYPKFRMEQYRKFVNHQTAYAPKPSNQWELGVNAGAFNILGDVPSSSLISARKATDALGFGVTLRKALGYTFSVRAQYLYGTASGLDYRARSPYNPVYRSNYAATDRVYHNYRTTYHELTLQLVAATNNIRFHKGKNAVSLYGLIGGGVAMYDPRLNLKKDGGGNYAADFNALHAAHGNVKYKDRKDVYDKLDEILDDTYETFAYKDSHAGGDNMNIIPVITAGVGLQFKLGKRVSLQIEDKVTFTGRDGLDGTIVQGNGPSGVLTPKSDLVNYASIGLGFNLGSKDKTVAPLWWINPLDHAYNELSTPRHMQLPEPTISDSDGDGVADMFDKCPGTPAGVGVDSHGCPLDTDGDGVPDYKDKQLITPTECQPVDADGVGKCPCPDGCEGTTSAAAACGTIGAGVLTFNSNSANISNAMASQLTVLASQLTANPTCKAVIAGSGNASKVQQQRSWDRVNAIIEYLSEKHGIDRNRFIFQYGATGDGNSVLYRAAAPGEDGPSTVVPPFPNLRKN